MGDVIQDVIPPTKCLPGYCMQEERNTFRIRQLCFSLFHLMAHAVEKRIQPNTRAREAILRLLFAQNASFLIIFVNIVFENPSKSPPLLSLNPISTKLCV